MPSAFSVRLQTWRQTMNKNLLAVSLGALMLSTAAVAQSVQIMSSVPPQSVTVTDW